MVDLSFSELTVPFVSHAIVQKLKKKKHTLDFQTHGHFLIRHSRVNFVHPNKERRIRREM